MRITNNMLISNMMLNLSGNLSKTQKYMNQLATGKKISLPSDDPIVASKSLKLRTDVAEIQQYRRNTDDATSWMEITEATMGQINEVLQRLREITNQAANGTNTDDDLKKITAESKQLNEQLVHLANATYAGRYVFSGYKTDKALMDKDGNFNIDISNSEKIQFEVGIGDNIDVNVPGSDLFNNGTNGAAGSKAPL
jgi:flagellar hook-associated protein 3 FlgL